MTAVRSTDARSSLLLGLVPPAMIAAALAFWGLAPEALTDSPWTIVAATAITTTAILGLEFVAERHASWRMTKREFATDLFYNVLNYSLIAWCTRVLADEPLTRAKAALGIATPWAMQLPFVVQVALVVVLVEVGQYWMHRAMHNWAPLWLTHAPHHHITQLNATKAAVGNPVELFLISLSVVALFDVPVAAAFCGFNVLAIVSGFAHANTRCDPPRWYAFVFTTIRNHSLHHSTGYEETRCNYANSLILLDRLFGTFRDGEAEAVGQGERRRLSIAEQTLFPVQPLIDRWKAPRDDAAEVAR